MREDTTAMRAAELQQHIEERAARKAANPFWHDQTNSKAKRICRMVIEITGAVLGIACVVAALVVGFYVLITEHPTYMIVGIAVVVISIFGAWVTEDDR